MVDRSRLVNKIQNEYKKIGKTDSKARDKVGRKFFKVLPTDEEKLIQLFDYLVRQEDWKIFWLVTKWIKRKKLYDKKYMKYYEKWLYNYINRWGSCDVFCYRVLNPVVENHPEFFKNVIKWSDSSKTYVRRAAPVCLMKSTRSFEVNFEFEKVIRIVDKLKNDQELHVQKGIGWLLKYSYLSYPNQVYDYLKNNVDKLERVTFRYALEKVPKKEKNELMKL